LRRAPRGERVLRMWVSLLVWVRKGRLWCGETDDDGCCSCDDADCSAEGGSSTSKCGAVGRQRISVMLRCFRIGFVYDPFAYAWAEVAGIEAADLGRGSQSEPGCNGPYSQVTSESLSLEWYKRREVKSATTWRRRQEKEGGGDGPVEGFRTDRLKFVPLFPPSSPASVFETAAVGNGILLPGHVLP